MVEQTMAVLRRLYPDERISPKNRGPDIPVQVKGRVNFLVDCKGSQPLTRAGNQKPDRATGQMIRYYQKHLLPIFLVVPDDWKRPRERGETGLPWKSQVESLFESVGLQGAIYVVTISEIGAEGFSFEELMKERVNTIQRSHSRSGEYIWYAGYGSNTLEERFLCYIKGGQFRLGGAPLSGCTDKSPPIDTTEFLIQHRMYFAGESRGWKGGATALLDPTPTLSESEFTRARVWKVTWEQFREIWGQEGKAKHDMMLHLGWHTDHCEIATFTSSQKIASRRPSDEYIQTIALGLRETFSFGATQTVDYLRGVEGIKGVIPPYQLEVIVHSADNLRKSSSR